MANAHHVAASPEQTRASAPGRHRPAFTPREPATGGAAARDATLPSRPPPRPSGPAVEPLGYLDAEPDLSWQAATGPVERIGGFDAARPPVWLQRSRSARRRARAAAAVSWMITAGVLVGVVGAAGLVMLGSDRFEPALRELTGLDLGHPETTPRSPSQPTPAAASAVRSLPAAR